MANGKIITPFKKQVWTVLGILSNMVGVGSMLSYPSSLLPALRAADSPFKIDLHTASWIASSVSISSIPGFFLSSFLMDCLGRKKTYAIIVSPAILGWLLVALASNVPTLMVGRVLCGVTLGASTCLGCVIIGEFTSPESRGVFLNLKTATFSIGTMLCHVLGNYFCWRTVALISMAPHIIGMLIVMTWPESPAWLAFKNELSKCRKDFFWLRGNDEKSVKELEELIEAQTSRHRQSREKLTLLEITVEFFKKFTRKDFLKPVCIISLGMVLMEVGGRHLFPAYASDIIGEVTGDGFQSFYYTLGIDTVIIVGTIVSSALMKLMKRRTLLFVTGFAALAVLAIVCVFLLLVSRGLLSNNYTWIPKSMLVLYFILVNLACTPMPLTFLGEILPLAHRGPGSVLGGIMFSLAMYVILHATPYLLASINVHGMLTVYGVCMGVTLLILYWILPETKDKTLQEIDNYFIYGSYEKSADDDDEAKTMMLERNANAKII